MIDLKKLQYFIAVAEELHVGRASERLGISQPPLSRQIKSLEDEFGGQLFHRGRSSISLTQAGERLLERATVILADLEDAKLEVRRIAQGFEGRLRIGFVGSSIYGILPMILKTFHREYPKIALSFYPMNNEGLRRGLIRKEIDIGVARPGIHDPEITTRTLFREPFVLATPATNPLAGKKSVSVADIAGDTLILFPENPRPSYADTIIRLCREKGKFDPVNRLFTMDLQAALALVAAEVGISIVPESVSESERKGVRFLKIDTGGMDTEISLNHRIDNQSIHIRNFCAIAGKMTKQRGRK